MNSVSVDRNMAKGFEVSHFRCSSASAGRSRTFCGSKTGIDPPLRLKSSAKPTGLNSLGEVHDLEAFGADYGELVFQEVYIERFCRNEEVLVQPEPFCPLAKEWSEWSTLPILGVAPQNRFKNSE